MDMRSCGFTIDNLLKVESVGRCSRSESESTVGMGDADSTMMVEGDHHGQASPEPEDQGDFDGRHLGYWHGFQVFSYNMHVVNKFLILGCWLDSVKF